MPKQALMLIAFVEKVTTQGSPDFIPPAERKYTCNRKSHIRKLDQSLDEAPKRGWTVVGMKDDWKTIYSSTTK